MLRVIDQKQVETPCSTRLTDFIQLDVDGQQFLCVTVTMPGSDPVVDLRQIVPYTTNYTHNTENFNSVLKGM